MSLVTIDILANEFVQLHNVLVMFKAVPSPEIKANVLGHRRGAKVNPSINVMHLMPAETKFDVTNLWAVVVVVVEVDHSGAQHICPL